MAEKWDEEAFREINDLDAARLAIRGALATIRDLQDINSQVKGEMQEEASRRKAAEAKTLELVKRVEKWEEQAAAWEKERKNWTDNEAKWKTSVASQVRAEESARIEEGRRALEEELSRMRAGLQQMAASQREKEDQWGLIKKQLDLRNAELLALQKEKVEMAGRFHKDTELVESLREQRDREIVASLRARDVELEKKERDILQLRRKAEEFETLAQQTAAEFERRLQEKEESLLREYRIKERALQDKYNNRETELQSSWAQLENGLWQRTKEAREKLDKAVGDQFEEKARALADRSREIEEVLASKRKDLEEEFVRKSNEAEARFAQMERRLVDEWADKERRARQKFDEQLFKEKESLKEQFDKRAKILEAEQNARLAELDRRAEDMESERKHKLSLLLEDAARKDAERIRRQDDFIAKKTSELERDHQAVLSGLKQKELLLAEEHQAREVALQEAYLKKETQVMEDLNRRKLYLLEEHARAVEIEKTALKAELDQQGRALDDAYRAKVAESDRAHKALEEDFQQYKLTVAAQYAQKEKDLDKQWYVREQELLRNHETAMEAQRRAVYIENQKTQEHYELARKRSEEDFVQKAQAARAGYEKMEADLKDAWAKREEELHVRHEAQLAEVRGNYQHKLKLQSDYAVNEQEKIRVDFEGRLNLLRETHQTEIAGKESELADRDLEIKKLQDKLDAAEKDKKTLWEDLRSQEKKSEEERLALEAAVRERENRREKKYLDMERALHDLWSRKEADYVSSHQAAIERQHAGFIKDLGEREEAMRRTFEQWKTNALAGMEKQKAEWMERQNLGLEDERRRLRADAQKYLETLNGEARLREEELRQGQAEAMAALRREMDAAAREREAAISARYLALENELAAHWAQKEQAAAAEARVKLAAELAAADERAARKLKQLEAELEVRVSQELRDKSARLDQEFQEKGKELDAEWKKREAELARQTEGEREAYRAKIALDVEAAVVGEYQERLAGERAAFEKKCAALEGELRAGLAREEARLKKEFETRNEDFRRLLQEGLKRKEKQAEEEGRHRARLELDKARAELEEQVHERRREQEAREAEVLRQKTAALEKQFQAREAGLREKIAALEKALGTKDKDMERRLRMELEEEKIALKVQFEKQKSELQRERLALEQEEIRREAQRQAALAQERAEIVKAVESERRKNEIARKKIDQDEVRLKETLALKDQELEDAKIALEMSMSHKKASLERELQNSLLEAQREQESLKNDKKRIESALREKIAELEKNHERAVNELKEKSEADRRRLESDLKSQKTGEGGLGELVLGIAGQVRRPMGVIRELVESRLDDLKLSASERQSMESIRKASLDLAQRLEALIDFSRPLRLTRSGCAADDIVARVATELSELCKKQMVKLETKIDRNVPFFQADKERLAQALLNLAVNAVESMPEGGPLTLSASFDPRQRAVVFEIQDRGAGMDAAQLQNFGKPFFTTKPGQAGMGAAVAHKVFHAHGGSVEMESLKAAGSRVVCRIPA